MLVELPMVTMVPPDSTNFLSCGIVLSSEMRPEHLPVFGGNRRRIGRRRSRLRRRRVRPRRRGEWRRR